jgi:hypothetical protein
MISLFVCDNTNKVEMENKPENYFLVTIEFIKNGVHPITEKHGVKGFQPTSELAHDKIKDSIKAMRKQNYPKDSISQPQITGSIAITKEQYEAIPKYLIHNIV